MRESRRLLLIACLLTPLLGLYLLLPPIAQDQAYHDFADQRTLFGLANFFDVASNLLFVGVGLAGLCWLAGNEVGGRLSWGAFFIGVLLVGPGSAWYHWSPDDASLVWDRLPIAAAFIGLLAAVLGEIGGRRLEAPMLLGGLLLGIYSVVHWRLFGDLRLYLAVQFTPILVVLFVAVAWRLPSLPPRYLVGAFLFYALAKLTEAQDATIFELTGQAISGHTLKHLLAAAAVYLLYRMKRRTHAAAPISAA